MHKKVAKILNIALFACVGLVVITGIIKEYWNILYVETLMLIFFMGVFFFIWVSLSYGLIARAIFCIKGVRTKATIIDYQEFQGENSTNYGLIVSYHIPEHGSYRKDLSEEQVISDMLLYKPSHEPEIGEQVWIYYNRANPEEMIHYSSRGVIARLLVWVFLSSIFGFLIYEIVRQFVLWFVT